MKRLLILALLAFIIVMPASAFIWNISGASGWTVSAYPANAYKMGDGDQGTNWYNAGSGNYTELTWSPSNYYSKARVYPASASNEYWTVNDVCTQILGSTWQNLSVSPGSAIKMRFYAADSACTVDNPWGKITEIQWENGTPPAPIANFTGAPLTATAPAYIAFTDTSENKYGTCEYNWSYTPTTGVLVAPQDLDNEDITMLFTENGNFSITHGLNCSGQTSIKTRTDYIHIVGANATSTFRVRAVDMLSGYGVNGAKVDVFDIENSSWTNQTSVTGEVTVSALTGHNINAYGSATGYDDGESLGLPVVAGSLYPIYMRPTDLPGNVSAGNVTLYLTVLEDGTNTRLSGYAVSLTGPSSGGADYTSGVTDANGLFTAVVKNRTNYNVKVLAQKGHLGANKAFNSGTQSGGDSYVEVTLWLGVSSVTTAPTVTTLPGGGTPTPTTTYLRYCDPALSDYNEDACRTSENTGMMDQLREAGPSIIGLCIVAILMGLLKIIMG
jgi:hypothetical protein